MHSRYTYGSIGQVAEWKGSPTQAGNQAATCYRAYGRVWAVYSDPGGGMSQAEAWA